MDDAQPTAEATEAAEPVEATEDVGAVGTIEADGPVEAGKAVESVETDRVVTTVDADVTVEAGVTAEVGESPTAEEPRRPEDPGGPEGTGGPEKQAEPEEQRGPEERAGKSETRSRLLSRRQVITSAVGASALIGAAVYESRRSAPSAPPIVSVAKPTATGYAPDGTAGSTAAFPLDRVALDASVFKANQGRNTDYLHFLDPDRMLHTFRLNYGIRDTAAPIGGWEKPSSEVRGHTTGHLLSGLAISYANTGDTRAKATAEYLVQELAALQQQATKAGFHAGYLSAFPEFFFDWLESGRPVWSPYYMIHKYMAGMIDLYQLAGIEPALDVATQLADWVGWRTGRLSYARMQNILRIEYGGLPESLANLYAITGDESYLVTAGRFYDAAFYDPLAAGTDALSGLHANTNVPKVIAALRMWEETGDTTYRDIAYNFWDIVTQHHLYVIGGTSNHEHWQDPDQVASQLSNYTCEGCVTYNLLKLARLLHFHNQSDTTYLDYYERALFNQMLGTQDPTSPHGFNCYYMGLSPDALKQQPLNYFPGGDPNIYATDYDTFTCDNATGLETQAKFADTIYSRDARGVYVNLFIASTVHCADQGVTIRQTTRFPSEPATTLTVTRGSAAMEVRVRVPGWIAGTPSVQLNGMPLTGARRGDWITVSRYWQPYDELHVTFPMTLDLVSTPDDVRVRAATYGPTVLAGAYGTDTSAAMPMLTEADVSIAHPDAPVFTATTDGGPVELEPVASINHQHFTVYWQTE